jgi:hypothetical protein
MSLDDLDRALAAPSHSSFGRGEDPEAPLRPPQATEGTDEAYISETGSEFDIGEALINVHAPALVAQRDPTTAPVERDCGSPVDDIAGEAFEDDSPPVQTPPAAAD